MRGRASIDPKGQQLHTSTSQQGYQPAGVPSHVSCLQGGGQQWLANMWAAHPHVMQLQCRCRCGCRCIGSAMQPCNCNALMGAGAATASPSGMSRCMHTQHSAPVHSYFWHQKTTQRRVAASIASCSCRTNLPLAPLGVACRWSRLCCAVSLKTHTWLMLILCGKLNVSSRSCATLIWSQINRVTH